MGLEGIRMPVVILTDCIMTQLEDIYVYLHPQEIGQNDLFCKQH